MSDCPRKEEVLLIADKYADSLSTDMRALCRIELCAALELLEMELVEANDRIERLKDAQIKLALANSDLRDTLRQMRDSTHTSAVVLRGVADNALKG